MTPVLALFTATFRSALPVRRSVLFGLLGLTPAVLFVLSAESRTGEFAFRTLIESSSTTYFALILPIIAIVLASGALGNERRDQTLSFIALRPMPRSLIVGTKITATVCAATAINFFSVLVLWLTYSFLHTFDLRLLLGFGVGTVVAVVAYVSILVPLGFITDRGVIMGLAYLLVFEDGIVVALGGLASLSPWRLGAAALGGVVPAAQNALDPIVGNLAMSTGGSIFTVSIYLVIGLGITTLLLKRRDLA